MSVSRRKFIVAGQTLLAATALPVKFFAAAASELNLSAAGNLLTATAATFQPLVNSSFAVRSGAVTPAWLTLLSVEDMTANTPVQPSLKGKSLNPQSAVTSVDTFALHFYGTGEKLEQGTYELQHHSFGRFSLFIVPSGVSTYMAIISHLHTAQAIPAPKPRPKKPMAGAPIE